MSTLPMTTEFMMNVVPQLMQSRQQKTLNSNKQGMFYDDEGESDKPIEFDFDRDDDEDDWANEGWWSF